MGEQEEEKIMPKYEYLSHEIMDGYYADILQKMAVDGYRPDVIIALSRGGLDMGVKFSNYFNDVPLEPLVWQTRDGVDSDRERLAAILSKYPHKDILVVDDILDSGKTLEQVSDAINDCKHIGVVDYAVAIENQDIDYHISYSSRTISRMDQEQWFVFPWENWWVSSVDKNK